MPALMRMRRTTMAALTPSIIIRHQIMPTIAITSIAGIPIIPAIPTLMTTSKVQPNPGRRVNNNTAAPAGGDGEMPQNEAAALYRLMTWLSPSFPIGAFSYSSGIEWAVEAGDIFDAASLREWLTALLVDGGGFCDGVFLAQAHRAVQSGDDARLGEI